jgi:hypothetical protein
VCRQEIDGRDPRKKDEFKRAKFIKTCGKPHDPVIFFRILSSVVFHTAKRRLNVCGPQVSQFRTHLGWSQPELAAKCQLAGWDVSRDIIARIEGQVRWVGDFEMAALAKVLKVPLEKLYPREIRSTLPK